MVDLKKLVERQLRLVEIKRELERLGEIPPRPKIDEIHYGPCLLLSRECGSNGEQIAHAVGQRLHWQVFDREIVEQIAQRAHVRHQLVESVDEHVRSRWRSILHPLQQASGIQPETYFFHLQEVVLALGHHGQAIIIGRGAQFLLPPQCALRVRVVAPLEGRIARCAAERNLSKSQAAEFVKQCESDRVEFFRKTFHQDTTSSLNYDLVLNSGELSVEAASAAILAALEAKLGVRPEAVAFAA